VKLSKNGLFVVLVFFILINSSGITNVAASPSVTISTDKDTYSYGDYLSFTIEVSEVTEEFAIMYIIDELGKGSSPINIPITELTTTLTAPFPFESTIYPEGKYFLEIEYADTSIIKEFDLIDSGNVVIPFWIKDLARFWVNETISDNDFAKGIEFLIKEGIIIVPETESQHNGTEIKIPNWIKNNAKWWIEAKISDNDFALGLQYLIKIGVIIV